MMLPIVQSIPIVIRLSGSLGPWSKSGLDSSSTRAMTGAWMVDVASNIAVCRVPAVAAAGLLTLAGLGFGSRVLMTRGTLGTSRCRAAGFSSRAVLMNAAGRGSISVSMFVGDLFHPKR